jgi:predicted heme/steroid binding protein
MALIAPPGNSEGSIYRGNDGKTYQVINGRDDEVSSDKSWVEGYTGTEKGVYGGTLVFPSQQKQSSSSGEVGTLIAVAVGLGLLLLLSRR